MTEMKKTVPGAAGKKKLGRAKPVVNESAKPATKKLREGVAFLIENELQRAEVVLAAKGINQKLQDMAENLSKLEANDIMPMLDSFRETFGPQAADQFSQVATAKIRELIGAVQGAKAGLDNEIIRLEKMVNGGDPSDAAMDAEMPPAPPPPAPEMPGGEAMAADMPPAGGEPDPTADMAPPVDADAMGAVGFAGRAKKESAAPKGRKLTEESAAESMEMKACLDALANFSPKCFSRAHDILDSIENLAVSGEVRNKLIGALGHLMSAGTTDSVWDDPGAMADLSIEKHMVDGPMAEVVKSPEIKSIFTSMHKLAHLLAMKHGGDLNEDEMMLPNPAMPAPAMPAPAAPLAAPSPIAAPTSMPEGVRSPLKAGPVFESRQRAKNVKRLREASNPDALVLAVFRRVFNECQNVVAAVNGTARAFSIDTADVVSIIREAKAESKKKSKVSEDIGPTLMGVEMADHEDTNTNPALMGQRPTAANPQEGKPNQPMTPADMRAQRATQKAQDNATGNQPNAPLVAPKTPLPVQQVKPGQQTVKPVVSPQMQQQANANAPKMPGKVVNNNNLRNI